MATHRLNLVMSDNAKNRLERLIGLTEASNNSEVVKNALRLYEAMINHSLNGEEFLLRNKQTGDITQYKVFEIEDFDRGHPNSPRVALPRADERKHHAATLA